MKKLVMLAVFLLAVPLVVAQMPQYPYGGAPSVEYPNPSLDIPTVTRYPYKMPGREEALQAQAGRTCQVACLAVRNQCIRYTDEFLCRKPYSECVTSCRQFGSTVCDRQCAADYGECVQFEDQGVCFNRFGECRVACVPEVQQPAPVSCEENCDDAYRRCLEAGGSVMTCSQGVYRACVQKCGPTGATGSAVAVQARPVMEVPVQACQLSCGARCGDLYQGCIDGKGMGCWEALEGCMEGCRPRTVIAENEFGGGPSAWQRIKAWFG